MLPNVPADAALSEEQKDSLARAVILRQQQLRRWMHWHAGAGQSRSANNRTAKIISDLLKPKTRAKKPCEVYSKVFFKTRIQPVIGTGMSIVDINKKIREMFENESPEVKEQIHQMTKEQNKYTKRGKSSETEGGESKEPDLNAGDVSQLEKDPDILHR